MGAVLVVAVWASGAVAAGENRIPADGPVAGVDALFDRVTAVARARAGQDGPAAAARLSAALRNLDYDAYRGIRFRRARALWGGDTDFAVQLFHGGYRFDRPVRMHTVEAGAIRPVAFDPDLFRYEGDAASIPRTARREAGFAGFRLHYPLNRPDRRDELIAFLGASYFRFLSAGQAYGLSARAVAVDIATSRGESFPGFRAFWLVRPASGRGRVTVIALLGGERTTGAYRFDIEPGDPSAVTVKARLFARTDLTRLGLAPLTSMFLHGGHSRGRADDYRPRVHDSGGLLVHTASGEWIWRPLVNPAEPRTTARTGPLPNGFGLVQRDRAFADYLDAGAAYERRPSYWVEPLGGEWGDGHVELYEFPTDRETTDNIGAYWVPERPLRAGDGVEVHYRLTSHDGRIPGHDLARAVRTRQGEAGVPDGPEPQPGTRRFVVDFAGGALAGLAPDAAVAARVRARHGTVTDIRAQALPDGSWRATFRVRPTGERPSDLRAWLVQGDERITETWNFVGSGRRGIGQPAGRGSDG